MKHPHILLPLIKATAILIVSLLYTGCGGSSEKKPEVVETFQLGIQSWTFNRMSLVEALDEIERMGIKYLQCYRNQKLGEGFDPDEKFHHTMKPETREKLLALLKKKNITLTSYGVVKVKSNDEWEGIFEFAKAMGMRDISIEPNFEDWPEVLPLVASLAKKYGIGIGMHHHAGPVSPSELRSRLEGYDEIIKFTPDTGSWSWSGFDPVDGLKALAGRIESVHMRDLTGMTRKSHDVPWGTGATNAAGQLLELRRQGFKGIVYIEYNYRGRNLVEDVELCVEYFNRAAKATDEELLKNAVIPPGYTTAEKTVNIQRKADSGLWPSPQPLFKDDLSDADFPPGAWEMKDGILRPIMLPKGQGGNIWTKEDYGDFVITGEFRCPEEKSNSGILIRCSDTSKYVHNSVEFQIMQGDSENPARVAGALYDAQEPTRQVEIETGKWYRFVATAKGNELNFYLDSEHLNRVRLNQWKEAGKNPDGTPNKFKNALGSLPKTGKLGLQYYKPYVEFRNLTIEKF